MKEITSFTIYNPLPSGHGAEKRTAQVVEVLAEAGFEWNKIPVAQARLNDFRKIWMKIPRILISYLAIALSSRFRPSLKRILKNSWLYSHFEGIFSLKDAAQNRLILLENTKMEFAFVHHHFKRKGKAIVALPHNLESLVPRQKSGISNRMSPHWFMEEIKLLRSCDHVFAISREETLLMQQLRINASYLPYYPTRDTFQKLGTIREKREQRNERKGPLQILQLGSVVNKPTRDGVLNRIAYFNALADPDFTVRFAGFGMDRLAGEINVSGSAVEILGEISNEKLEEEMIACDMLLIHQEASSGALTRIPESLIAGIPVVLNFTSARSMYELDGVYTYNDDDEMLELLRTRLPQPGIPARPDSLYAHFVGVINSMYE